MALRRSHLRRNALIFLAALGVHAWLGLLAETEPFESDAAFGDDTAPATPIEIVPRLPQPPAKPKPKPPRLTPIQRRRPPSSPTSGPPAPLIEPPVPQTGPEQSAVADTAVASAGPDAKVAAQPDLPTITPPPAQSYPINPGYWEVDEHWLVMSRTERYCVAPENIVRFMAAPCNHIYHCSYTRQDIDNGKLSFAGVITAKDQRYNVRGSGEYSTTHLKVSVQGLGHWHILPVAFGASLEGHFIASDCPADAKRIGQK